MNVYMQCMYIVQTKSVQAQTGWYVSSMMCCWTRHLADWTCQGCKGGGKESLTQAAGCEAVQKCLYYVYTYIHS
jgi:hypothetical protein